MAANTTKLELTQLLAARCEELQAARMRIAVLEGNLAAANRACDKVEESYAATLTMHDVACRRIAQLEAAAPRAAKLAEIKSHTGAKRVFEFEPGNHASYEAACAAAKKHGAGASVARART